VVEPLRPPALFEWFVGFRESLGMEVIPLGPDAGARVASAVRAGRITCLLCDRQIGDGGVDVEFFGERTRLPAGPATLAMRTGAALIPVACYFEGDGVHALVRPPLDTARQGRIRDDVVRVTRALAGELEVLIRTAPTQWHLLQPNWPSDHVAR
jgi:phosphatidylinositol dimannoside acyltransferase